MSLVFEVSNIYNTYFRFDPNISNYDILSKTCSSPGPSWWMSGTGGMASTVVGGQIVASGPLRGAEISAVFPEGKRLLGYCCCF